ncbi:MAG: efflux RND transporter periplasmic adaptor subunit [Gammaproteobacteria bacterium]|nr:efflux RND transporter periplasmic adaptor subunit [Gammaproteobacteria bacterium]
MNDKIDRLAELRIDRSEQPETPARWPLWLAGAVVALAIAWFGLRALTDSAVPVTTETVRLAQESGGGASVLDGSGYVVARRQATVSSEISGKVLEVLIEEGMIVEEGQVVAYLDNSMQMAQLALSRAQLVSAKAQLSETQAQLTQAELELKRFEELAGRKLASASELDAARANAETLRARLQTGQENVTVAQRRLEVSQDQLDKTTIRAPFAGVVVTKNAQPGEMISPNSAGGSFTRTGICTIVDMESLEIEVDVNEAYIQRVYPEQPVTATLDAYPDWKIPARVIAIVPTADRQKATVRVRIGFLERDERILRDMGVKVAFLDESTNDDRPQQASLYISDGALRSDGEGNYVWIVRGDAVQRRPVTVGQRSSRGVQVLTGLGAGDRIVLAAEGELSAGQPVRDQ